MLEQKPREAQPVILIVDDDPGVLLHAVERAVEKSRLERENRRLLEELKAKREKLWTLKQRETFST